MQLIQNKMMPTTRPASIIFSVSYKQNDKMWQLCTAVSLGCILGLWGLCFLCFVGVVVLFQCWGVVCGFGSFIYYFFLDMYGAFFVLLN